MVNKQTSGPMMLNLGKVNKMKFIFPIVSENPKSLIIMSVRGGGGKSVFSNTKF